jgi:hypothetical protein
LPRYLGNLRDQKYKYMQDSATETKEHALQNLEIKETDVEDG